MNGVIFQCASCRALAAIDEVRVHEERAGLRCGVCGTVTWLPIQKGEKRKRERCTANAAELPHAPAVTSMAIAPPRPPNFNAEQREKIERRLQALPAGTPAQDELARAFEALFAAGASWSDPAAHKELCKRASMLGELAFLGQRYRAVLEEAPGDAAAKQAQGEILTLATVALAMTKDLGTAPSDEVRKRRSAAALVVGACIVVAVFFVLHLAGLLHPQAPQEMIEGVEIVQ